MLRLNNSLCDTTKGELHLGHRPSSLKVLKHFLHKEGIHLFHYIRWMSKITIHSTGSLLDSAYQARKPAYSTAFPVQTDSAYIHL